MRLLEYIDDTALGFGSYVIESPPRTLSHCYLAFLLSWQITLTQFRDAEPDKRAGYANFFRQRNMTGPLLKIVYSILPHDEGNLLSAEPVFIEGRKVLLPLVKFSCQLKAPIDSCKKHSKCFVTMFPLYAHNLVFVVLWE